MNKNLTSKKLKNLIFEFESNFVTVNFQNQTNIVIPPEIPENHRDISIGIDIMFINGIPFLKTISHTVKFSTATEMNGANMDNVVTVLKTVPAIYRPRVFNVLAVAADSGFTDLKTNPDFIELKITLNLIAEDEHEPYVEKFNRTIKEMCRIGLAGVPFTKLPKRMVVELVYEIVFWFNYTIPDD